MITVPAIEDMDAKTFYQHINKRHMPIGGCTSFRSSPEDEATKVLRTYHKRLHETEDLKHDHHPTGGEK